MTSINPNLFQGLTIDQLLNPHLLTVSPTMTVAAVVDQMGQRLGPHCQVSQGDAGLADTMTLHRHSCALVMEQDKLCGIFTERDLVCLVAEGVDLEAVAIAQVMSHPVRTLPYAETYNLFSVLSALKEWQVRQLPVLKPNGQLLGLVTQTTIRQALHPFNFLKLRQVEDSMTPAVIQAAPTDSLITLVQHMAQERVSCVVITERQASNPSSGDELSQSPQQSLINAPIGIVTERDIVQFRAIGLSLTDTLAQTVMSTPLFLVHPQTSLWDAHQRMEQHHVRRLVVVDENGQLAGIVTQTSVLAPP